MANYSDTGLGKQTQYKDQYDASLLYPIPRSKARHQDNEVELPFQGVDIWTAFEISWLNSHGLPQIAIGEFFIPCTSEAIVESKSVKLYLNSFNQTPLDSMEAVSALIAADLSAATGSIVDVVLYQPGEYNGFKPVSEPDGICLDNRPVAITSYQPDSSLLFADPQNRVSETLYSHLLRTNCPVTDQPDWASVYISYEGPAIDPDGLLKYIVSFRQHQDFHEQCVEKIYRDVLAFCQPTALTVYARYMRRGGVDINPFRSSHISLPPAFRQERQ